MSSEKLIPVDEATEKIKLISLDGKTTAMSEEEKKVMISIVCGDGKTLKVDEATAFMSELIKSDIKRGRRIDEETAFMSESTKIARVPYDIQARMRHEDWPNVVLKLSVDPNLSRIPSDLLEKAFRYCAHAHAHDNLHAFERQFVDPQLLMNLMMAASVLHIEGLHEFALHALVEIGMPWYELEIYKRNVPFRGL